MSKSVGNIVIEGARIMFRNFSGKESQFNRSGQRNFCLVIDEDLASRLVDDGWNVKHLKPREEGDSPLPYINVAVSYDNYPPKIYLISGNSKTLLDEESCSVLDHAEIENVDIVVRPYCWDVSGKSGVKAYVKNMYVTIKEDEFEAKYRMMENEDDLPWND